MRGESPCNRFRARGWFILLPVALLMLAAKPAVPPSSHPAAIQSSLQEIADRDGMVAFLAVYWLPESHDWFLSATGDTLHRAVANLHDLEDTLSPQQRSDALNVVAEGLAGLTDDQRRAYFQRLSRWRVAYLQLDLMLRFHSIEIVEEAMISLPATRPVYDNIVASRSFDPSQVTPQLIAETMTSGETDDTWHRAITVISSFTDVELMRYLGDLYDRLAGFPPEIRYK